MDCAKNSAYGVINCLSYEAVLLLENTMGHERGEGRGEGREEKKIELGLW